MRKERVYTDYRRWSDDALATLAGRTVEFMTDNTNFAEPQPALADYTLLVTDYRQKLEIARNRGSQVEVTAKNNARRALLRAMKQRSEEHTSELQSLMRISYAVFCLKQKNKQIHHINDI